MSENKIECVHENLKKKKKSCVKMVLLDEKDSERESMAWKIGNRE